MIEVCSPIPPVECLSFLAGDFGMVQDFSGKALLREGRELGIGSSRGSTRHEPTGHLVIG